ncbi:MAG TPA: copper resistance protein CopC [Gemmatimonadaceae bacterium]|nr:copper resistance protein CopC [Gemmatimonadaceae bacterium]
MIHRSFWRPARRRTLLLGAVVGALASTHATAAHATPAAPRFHATLLSSEPAKGSTVASSPARIYLVFSEEVEPSLGAIRLVGPGGRVVQLKTTGDPRNVSALLAPVPAPLAAGIWRVEWRIVSEDGHPIDGDFTFTVGEAGSGSAALAPPAAAVGPEHDSLATGPRPVVVAEHEETAMEQVPKLPAALRGLAVGLLTALVGLLWLLETRRDRARQPRAERLAARLSIGTALLFAAHLVVWALAVSPDRSLGGDQMVAMLVSRVGQVEVARTVFAVLACWALVLARRERIALVLAVVAMLVSSATGHSAAIHPVWTVPARALHLLAVAVWFGGLLWLLTLERSSAAVVAAEAARVSSLALAGVIVVSITGVVQTKFFIGEWGEVVRSAYGAVVILKVVGLGVLALFGAHHKFRVLPRLAEAGVADGFSRTLRIEVLVLSLVILVGGLLAYVPPPQH